MELAVSEREMLSSKLGHEPEPGYAAWVVEEGPDRKRTIIDRNKASGEVTDQSLKYQVW